MANGNSKGRKPDYNIRVQVNGFWTTVGAIWNAKDGALSIRLHMLPLGEFDGSMLALPVKEDSAE